VYRVAFTGDHGVWVEVKDGGCETDVGVGTAAKINDQAAAKYAIHWLVHVAPAYTELLVQRKPDPLLILGHFAVHQLRSCWTMGGAGRSY